MLYILNMEFNIYCDESCHLEYDNQPLMVLGAIWCPKSKVKEFSIRLKEIKIKHGLPGKFEVKWVKVSESKQVFYLDYLDYFFNDDDLHFRALIAPKLNLNHKYFNQTHDGWYYKMYFNMLKIILSPDSIYDIYIDIKDTRGGYKIKKLHDVLCSNMYDFSREIIRNVQLIRSDESNILQLTDLLIGAISYINRGMGTNKGKISIVERLKLHSHYSLIRSTLFKENKVNIFKWHPNEF